jgi:hypothetical protein
MRRLGDNAGMARDDSGDRLLRRLVFNCAACDCGNALTCAVCAPTESPQVQAVRGDPHKKSTDDTALPGTRRHRC